MTDYNQRIDEQIAACLDRTGAVRVDALSGIGETDAALMLQQYATIHAEQPLSFDGVILVRHEPAKAADARLRSRPETAVPSPVDQVLAAPPRRALLDSAPSGPPVSRLFWLLPLSLGALGGVVSWFAVKDQNPRAARALLLTGIAVQIVSLCVSLALARAVGDIVPTGLPT